MPYIDPRDRAKLDALLEAVARNIDVGGELNYAITYLAKAFIAKQGGQSYAEYRGVFGDLFIAALELYRHKVGPYEEGKLRENGDVVPGLPMYALPDHALRAPSPFTELGRTITVGPAIPCTCVFRCEGMHTNAGCRGLSPVGQPESAPRKRGCDCDLPHCRHVNHPGCEQHG